MKTNIVPCVVFAFNRPDKLERVLTALKNQDIERLIVFVDGPRNEADVSLVEECRTIARSVNWVSKKLYFWDQNRGLSRLIENIDLIMEAYPSAVFVEDDCLPMPGFYSFMRQALLRYKSEKRVFSIGGYQPIPQKYFKHYPYSLVSCARFLCWGWATWQDRWNLIRPYLSRYWELFDNLEHVSDIAGYDLAAMARSAAQGRSESWDVKVSISTLWLKKVHLLPTRGLVRNISVGSGIHAGKRSAILGKYFHNRNITEQLPTDLVWLENVELNDDYVQRLRRFVRDANGLSMRLRWNRVKRVLRRRLKPHRERLYDLDLEQDRSQSLTKRALLSYIVYPFSMPRSDPRFLRHINIWHVQEIVRILNRLGYIVDVIDYRDERFIPRRQYDLFIGHGGINFEKIAHRLPDSATKIYFSTGCYWRFINQHVLSRFEALRYRRGRDLSLDQFMDRLIESEEEALLAADGVIGVGNAFTRETYTDFSPVIMLNNTTLFDDHYEWCEKDFYKGRDHFLYFAGAKSVHKGLDLLLEAFAGLEQHLWICCRMSRQFEKIYSKELRNCSNIHLIGWVQPRSCQYYRLMRTCNYAILPSSSEGQAQSMLECMNQGVIPVVSKACGLDVGDYGMVLDPCTVEEIHRVVQMLSAHSPAQCREMSLKARRAAVSDFSEEAFSSNMQAAIESIVRNKRQELPGIVDRNGDLY